MIAVLVSCRGSEPNLLWIRLACRACSLYSPQITEEALPTYLNLLNTLEGVNDATGAVETAWGHWSRQWTAEENRHGACESIRAIVWAWGRGDTPHSHGSLSLRSKVVCSLRTGDLLNRYLYLGGRVSMRDIEETIMRLISSGFDPDTRCDPYRGFIYTSFQVSS